MEVSLHYFQVTDDCHGLHSDHPAYHIIVSTAHYQLVCYGKVISLSADSGISKLILENSVTVACLIDSLTPWHWFVDFLLHCFVHAPLHSFTDSTLDCFIESMLHCFSACLFHGFIDSLVHGNFHSFIHAWAASVMIHWIIHSFLPCWFGFLINCPI